MAMNIPGLSAKIITEIQAQYGTADDAATLKKFADAMAKAFIDYVKENADIELAAADIKVDPGSFKDSLNAPVTGVATIQAVTLSTKIK